MKFKFLIFFFYFFLFSSFNNFKSKKNLIQLKGFAYIYNDNDFNKKIIKGKMNNEIMQISHQNLKTGTLIKIINPKNKESIVLKKM